MASANQTGKQETVQVADLALVRSQLFERSGLAFVGAHSLDEKGKPFITRQCPCSRCGGEGGASKWDHTGWTCYQCGGTGKGSLTTIKLYTLEQLAKLDVAYAKRQEKAASKAAERRAIRDAEIAARKDAFIAKHGALLARIEKDHLHSSEFITSVYDRAIESCTLTDKQEEALVQAMDKRDAEKARRAASEFIGEVGDRIERKVTVKYVHTYERPRYMSYGEEAVCVLTMRDEHGNTIVSKSARFWAKEGEAFTLKATVKAHSEYKGDCQTIVNRAAKVSA